MAFLKKLKKGGVARWAIYNATQNDTFTVPRGFTILNMFTESLATVTGTNNITVGVSPGVVPVQTWTVAGTAGGTASAITVDGVSTAPIANGQTAAQVAATLYYSTLFPYTATTSAETWTLAYVPGSNVVTAIGNVPKTVAAVAVSYGTVTGITVTTAQVVAGSVDSSLVSATALSNYQSNYPGQSPMKALSPAAAYATTPATDTPSIYQTFQSCSSTTLGTFVINGTTFTPATLSSATVANAASAVVNAVNATSNVTGLYAFTTSTSGQVVIGVKPLSYSQTSSAPIAYNFTGITGAVVGTVTTNPADNTFYINMSTPTLAGLVNVYVEIEKLN